MKKIIQILSLCVAFSLVLVAAQKEWLPKGKVVEVSEYNPSNPHSPAALSIINSKNLSSKLQKGQKIYAKWCSACHGVNMPGTNALAVLYKDTGIPALLEERTDLSPDIVSVFVRYGKHSMPFFRKTEINDEELKLLGEYLEVAHKYKK